MDESKVERLFVPWNENVLARRIEAAADDTGVIVPSAAQDKPVECEVLAVMPQLTPCGNPRCQACKGHELVVGARILIGRHAGIPVKLAEYVGELVILKGEEILGRFTAVLPPINVRYEFATEAQVQ